MRTLLLVFVVLLQGCASWFPVNSLSPGYPIERKENVGYIFGTLTQTYVKKERSAIFDDSYESFIYIDNNLKGAKNRYSASVVGGKNNEIDPRFPDENGSLFVFELSAGKHQLDYWSGKEVYTTITPSKDPEVIVFEVEAGEVLYIGNMHMNLKFGKNFMGAPVISLIVPEIKHNFERDKILLREEYVLDDNLEIVNKPLLQGIWSAESDN